MVKRAGIEDMQALAQLAVLLWPGHSTEELKEEFTEIYSGGNAQFFLCCDGDTPIGFAQCQLRFDYVEGTDSSPVGYLEGIFVKENYRRRGCARALLAACETWAREAGCREFASDCEFHNLESLHFHLSLGFLEANRIICFTKQL